MIIKEDEIINAIFYYQRNRVKKLLDIRMWVLQQ